MTDDLISRAEAIAAIQAAGGGYIMSMEVISALPAADLSSPLGAVAMRDAAANRCDGWAGDWDGEQLGDAIRAIPLPTHAALLAHAMRLPEVAAMKLALIGLVDRYDEVVTTPDCSCSQDDHDVQVARSVLAALEAHHE